MGVQDYTNILSFSLCVLYQPRVLTFFHLPFPYFLSVLRRLFLRFFSRGGFYVLTFLGWTLNDTLFPCLFSPPQMGVVQVSSQVLEQFSLNFPFFNQFFPRACGLWRELTTIAWLLSLPIFFLGSISPPPWVLIGPLVF